MKITKEHAGRYELRNGRNLLIGHVVKERAGWTFDHTRGGKMPGNRATPIGILHLATICGLINGVGIDWVRMVRYADAAFEHNVRIAAGVGR